LAPSPDPPSRRRVSSPVLDGSAIEPKESAPLARRPRGPHERLALVIATAFGAGLLPVAPGTAGSLAALPIFVLLSPLGPLLLLLTGVALFFLGLWAADLCEPLFGREDDGRIVIDEVVGQLLALAPLLPLRLAGSGAWSRLAPALVTGFVLFRVFDVWKPGPVAWAERRFRGGLGVMLDDVVAGGLAALLLAVGLALLGDPGAVGSAW